VDLEQRFWHALTRTGEWTPGADSLCFEEVTYTLFTVAQVGGRLLLGRLGCTTTAHHCFSNPPKTPSKPSAPTPNPNPSSQTPTHCTPQLLGFMEVCRREGPRERNFLDEGSLAGSDTLFTLLEAMRFIMCASPVTLQSWGCEGDARDHPGARERKFVGLRTGDSCVLEVSGFVFLGVVVQ